MGGACREGEERQPQPAVSGGQGPGWGRGWEREGGARVTSCDEREIYGAWKRKELCWIGTEPHLLVVDGCEAVWQAGLKKSASEVYAWHSCLRLLGPRPVRDRRMLVVGTWPGCVRMWRAVCSWVCGCCRCRCRCYRYHSPFAGARQ
ncbi:hypothetical protein AG1IA_08942 [Rhizoctonia solani AG-1 IA]|uniref:Uncharacterized protein n=1 Tax=Thanatephorus cucumeris (strain AG1-IA) TaxID=983506 RepID=L8WFR5_THACA|nr:hypothetical protein AG1IA_08942 [Rhizoctonia solani AG-1 IA]